MINPKDVTIIIPHLGATKEQQFALQQCLPSLLETCESDIVLAVNAAGSEKENGGNHLFALQNDRTKLMTLEEQGQCKAVNAAAATVNTPWILITNDDMIYAPGWFERLIEPHGKGFLIRCISPRLVEPRQGAPTFEHFFAGGAGGDFDKQKWLGYAEEHREHIYQLQPGFNLPLLIKKDLWDMVGGYDVNYDPWGSNSDSDLEYKIKLAGIQPYQNPNSVVYHFSQTSGTFEPRNGDAWGRNWQYFIDKWGFSRTDEGIWQATFEIPIVEQGRKFTPDWEGRYK